MAKKTEILFINEFSHHIYNKKKEEPINPPPDNIGILPKILLNQPDDNSLVISPVKANILSAKKSPPKCAKFKIIP